MTTDLKMQFLLAAYLLIAILNIKYSRTGHKTGITGIVDLEAVI